uniref:Uncharacterized protein n=1 Tax=Anopheles dirus TaxID=7168 RepID=A0A182N6T8_9DIPT
MYSNGDGALFQPEALPAPRATYRREFDEMENRIRKCERQRAELERQFESLMRERAECEKAAERAMKQRQRRKLEAERQRAERNESILRMLNKIDQQAASLAAKTDRLKMLKTQYEMYLMRTWSQPHVAYNVPMIAAPPPPKMLQSPNPVSTKSEFVQYLSDLTHQQTTTVNPIPPPTALSNYLASQQKPFGTPSVSYGPSLERPFSRALNSAGLSENDVSAVNVERSGSSQATIGGSRAKKFELSNEDFIRYIDSEVLKEPIPTVSVVAATPTEMNETKPLKGGAYLEDASEEEPVGELTSKLEEFSMLIEAAHKEKKPQDDIHPTKQANESGAAADLSIPEVVALEIEEPPLKQSPQVVTFEDDLGTAVDTQSRMDNEQGDEHIADRAEQYVQELDETPAATETSVYAEEEHNEPTVEERYQELGDTTYAEQSNYNIATDTHSNGLISGDNQTQEMLRETDNNSYPAAQPEYNAEQYVTTTHKVEADDTTYTTDQQYEHPDSRNQHWNTARQAMRAKAFPATSSKPPSPEMVQNVESVSETTPSKYAEETLEQSPLQVDNSEHNAAVENISQNAEYPQYAVDSSNTYYEADTNVTEQQSIDQAQASSSQGYHNDAMGQPVEYQDPQYQPSQLGEGQQPIAYQYEDNPQATYQQGQYVEQPTTDDAQYQYQDQSGDAYATQEAYQDPNQQYQQYDENAQYYGDQQQGYDGQYYAQDAQQQQQYYMDESQQQPLPEQSAGQYEQQLEQPQPDQPTEQYPQPNDSAYYPSDAQYEQTAVQHQPDQAPASVPTADASSPKDSTLQSTLNAQSVEPSAAVDTTVPLKDKQSVDKKPAKKDAEPGSDGPPTLSTVNDESDFDFSSQ